MKFILFLFSVSRGRHPSQALLMIAVSCIFKTLTLLLSSFIMYFIVMYDY